jgi:hypothetical protein
MFASGHFGGFLDILVIGRLGGGIAPMAAMIARAKHGHALDIAGATAFRSGGRTRELGGHGLERLRQLTARRSTIAEVWVSALHNLLKIKDLVDFRWRLPPTCPIGMRLADPPDVVSQLDWYDCFCEGFRMTAHRDDAIGTGPSSESLQARNPREVVSGTLFGPELPLARGSALLDKPKRSKLVIRHRVIR